jgi:hypothetical protein
MTTIQISDKRCTVVAKNGVSFPRLSDNMAARMLRQDVCVKSDHYVKGISFERVPVLGRCPLVQL